MEHPPSEILAMVLKLKNWDCFNADPIRLHTVFYELYEKNRDAMQNFNFIKRSNPFCTTLQSLITLFQLVGVLSRSNPEFLEYRINKQRLSELLPENTEDFPKLIGLDALDQFGKCALV
jgi:hypothetical protein